MMDGRKDARRVDIFKDTKGWLWMEELLINERITNQWKD